ncbi:MAG: carbohydrate-binding domain-containing protein [Butyrivibrio sp.]|nr:carbohydrate-binding domain-containing protein [Butyrivibrio sp.]
MRKNMWSYVRIFVASIVIVTLVGACGKTAFAATSSSASEIVYSSMSSSAASLSESTDNATTYTMSSSNNEVKIDSAGVYIVTGSCSDGNIIVKKGTTGVTLILNDLTLASSTSAPLSINKTSQAKIVISGTVTLTDNENAADENSTDTDVADAFDGACIKVKDGADCYITGSGTLTLKGNTKNGIKSGDDSATVCIIDGPTVSVTATNDGINAGYDLSILSGNVTVSAGDDGIHADRILTIGSSSASPTVTISKSNEGLEGSVVNVISGTVSVKASDDGINAANSDGTYESSLAYSINWLGGKGTINCSGDGLDSNGNINLVAGSLTINSGSTGGEAGIDYVNSLYVSDDFSLTNNSGVSSDASMGGGMQTMQGQIGKQNNTQGGNTMTGVPSQNMGGQMDRQGMNKGGKR